MDPKYTTVTDRYTLQSLLGKGGMGEVYLARDHVLNKNVAIKLIRAEYCSEPRMRQRFNQEARAFSYLKHENIVEVYDFGMTNSGRLYLSMEYVQGDSLRCFCDRVFPLNTIRDAICQLLDALAHAHARGVIHRDLKPENVLVTWKNNNVCIKLVDFGLAEFPSTPENNNNAVVLLGTPAYMAPEQVKGRAGNIGPESDLYSVGIICYEILCGHLPFIGSNGVETILKQVQEPIPPIIPRAPFPTIPGIEEIIQSALSKKIWNRPINATEFKKQIQALKLPDNISGQDEGFDYLKTCVEEEWINIQDDEHFINKNLNVDDFQSYFLQADDHISSLIVEDLNLATPIRIKTPQEHCEISRDSQQFIPIRGRNQQRIAIHTLMQETLNGKGTTFPIRGEHGVGKTRLVNDIIAEYAEDFRIISTTYRIGENTLRGQGLRGIFEVVLGTENVETENLANYILNLNFFENLDAGKAAILVDYMRPAPCLSSLSRHATNIADQAIQVLANACWRERLHELAIQRPIAFIIDDVQWATKEEFEMLISFAEWILIHRDRVILFPILDTTEAGPENLDFYDRMQAQKLRWLLNGGMTLEKLSDQDIMDCLSLDLQAAPNIAQQIANRADGNPWIAQTILKFLIQSGELHKDDADQWQFVRKETLPNSLPLAIFSYYYKKFDRIQNCLRTKSEPFYEILLRIAVLGESVSKKILSAFFTLEADPVLNPIWKETIDTWFQYNILKPEIHDGEEFVTFENRWWRETLLATVPTRRLRRIHFFAAGAKKNATPHHTDQEAETIACHYEKAYEKNLATQMHLNAAKLAMDADHYAYAKKQLDALYEQFRNRFQNDCDVDKDSIQSPIPWLQLLTLLINWNIICSDNENAEFFADLLSKYATLTGDHYHQALSIFKKSTIRSRQGFFQEALEIAGNALKQFSDAGYPEKAAEAMVQCARQSALMGNHDNAKAWLSDAMQLAGERNCDLVIAHAERTLSMIALLQGNISTAFDCAETASDIFERKGRYIDRLHSRFIDALIDVLAGNWDHAANTLLSVSQGYVSVENAYFCNLTNLAALFVNMILHNNEFVVQNIDDLHLYFRQIGDIHGTAVCDMLTAILLSMRYRRDEAIELAEDCLISFQQCSSLHGTGWCSALLAELYLKSENPALAESHLQEAIQSFQNSGDAIGMAVSQFIKEQLKAQTEYNTSLSAALPQPSSISPLIEAINNWMIY